MTAPVILPLVLGFIAVTHCYIEPIDLPPGISTCLQAYNSRYNDSRPNSLEAHADCLDQFVWKTGRIRWSDYNVTQEDLEFLKSLSKSFVHEHRRTRRTLGSPLGPIGMYPTSGPRIRREIRRLTDRERNEFFDAMNVLKRAGTYDLFVSVHSGVVLQSAHFGGNFPSWHRVYCALFEEALRRVNPRVSLSYWDTTFEHGLSEPVYSIMWSTLFLGNGDGYLRTGAFAGWRNINGDPIARNINGDGTLFSKQAVDGFYALCRHSDALYPTARPEFNFELLHGGGHLWVGGQMSGLTTTVADPIFFLYHCYLDYLWERWRIHQAEVCRIDPTTDMPPATGLHNPLRRMDAFPFYRNIDGYAGFWTESWYRYEDSPTCGPGRPSCGSPYLRCSVQREQCVSVLAPVEQGFQTGYRPGMSREAFLRTVLRSQAEVRTVFTGVPFPRPPSIDSRTSIRRFDRERNQERMRRDVSGIDNIQDTIMDNETTNNDMIFDKRDHAELLPPASEVWKQRSGSTLQPPVQNSFVIDGKVDQSDWVYMPVRVVSFESEFAYHYLNLSLHSSERRNKCSTEISGASQIKIQSQGLSYNGVYENLVLVDSNIPVSTSVVYIGVKDPRDQAADVLITVTDSCKRPCEIKCLISGGNQPNYKTCDGAIKLTNQPPLMYGKTVEEVAASIWRWTDSILGGPREIPLVFVCL